MTPWANGLDGYAYAVQILSLDTTGQPMIAENSPVVYGLAALNWLVGDPVLTTKIASAMLSALIGLGLRSFLLACGVGESRIWWVVLAAGISPTLTLMSVEYVKNEGALALFFFAAAGLVTWHRSPHFRWSTVLGTAALVVLTFLAHRVSAVLLGVFALALLLQHRGWSPWFRWGVAASVVPALAVVALWRGGLTWADWQRVAPALAWGPFLPLASPAFRDQLPLPVVVELSLAVMIPWLLAPKAFAGGAVVFRALWITAALALAPVFDLSVVDLGFRLLCNGVPLTLALTALAWPVRTGLREPRFPLTAWVLCLACLAAGRGVYRLQNDPPWRLYAKVTSSVNLPPGSLLIAHAGLNHYYTYTHQLAPALNYLPEFFVAPEKLWRLERGVGADEFAAVLPDDSARRDFFSGPGGYALVREDAWQRFLALVSAERRRELDNWYNPTQVRPEFLLQKN